LILGILEFAVFVLLVVSLIRLEFLPHRDKGVLQVALAVALLVFAVLAFGQTITGQFAGTASLYTYFGSTVVILILVSLMPPNRPDRWLGGSVAAAATARDDLTRIRRQAVTSSSVPSGECGCWISSYPSAVPSATSPAASSAVRAGAR
jgi:hypothetical protein